MDNSFNSSNNPPNPLELVSLADQKAFLKYERRTSAIYTQLVSKKIRNSSAYNLPEQLKKLR